MSTPADFHDPYSELSLFLAQKVKEEFIACEPSKKWSLQIQEKLIEKITPEFQKKFPDYRLGVATLKKVWEKMAYFSHTLENQKEAINADGHLNLDFLIRENLKQLLKTKRPFFHPYLLAQQLALKIAECLAIYDGVRPMLRHLTNIIWSIQRHLIPPMPNPNDTFDTWDKLILKFMLQASSKNPLISQEDLEKAVRHTLSHLDNHHLIQEETAYILIDYPDQDLAWASNMASQFFTKAQEIAAASNWVEVEHKIGLWTMQGDLVYRLIQIDNNPILAMVRQGKTVDDIIQHYPHLSPFRTELRDRLHTFTCYAWYALDSSPHETTVDRFFKWHHGKNLEALCKKQLPLLPYAST